MRYIRDHSNLPRLRCLRGLSAPACDTFVSIVDWPVFLPNRHHHAFLLEDDVEISPHFYAWAKWATLTYQYGEESDFMRDMYGVSLYTPRCVGF